MQVEKMSHRRSHEPKHNMKNHGRVKEMGRMGEMGETPHGRDNEAAAAMGPGMKTTDHLWTDGVSLATLASVPRDDQEVRLDLIKPPPSPSSFKYTTPPIRTSLHANESSGNGWEVVERDNNNNNCRAHECADNPVYGADMSTNETTATATASVSIDAAAPHRDKAKASSRPPARAHQACCATTQTKWP